MSATALPTSLNTADMPHERHPRPTKVQPRRSDRRPRPTGRGEAWFQSRMLALADRLFTEFDAIPVMTVIRAIVAAHAQVGVTAAEAPTPENIYAIAREQLVLPTS